MGSLHPFPGSTLTHAQHAQLKALQAAAALDTASAIHAYDERWGKTKCNPTVLGATMTKGLTGLRAGRAGDKGATTCTHYWLTAAGVAELLRIEAALAAAKTKGPAMAKTAAKTKPALPFAHGDTLISLGMDCLAAGTEVTVAGDEKGLYVPCGDGQHYLHEESAKDFELKPPAAKPAKAIYLPLQLRHDQIVPDPDNARKDFDPESLADLAQTLLSHGLKQPPRALPANAEGKHQLIMGERRWRAWGQLIADGRWDAGHTELVLIEDADDLERLEAGLIENLQRDDLNHMEAGLGFELLHTRCGRSNKEIAAALGASPEYVQQHRRLAQLTLDDQARVRDGRLTMHEALRVLSQPKPVTFDDLPADEQLMLAEIVDHVGQHRDKRTYGYGKAECSYLAGKDPVLKRLIDRRLVTFAEKDWQTHKAYIELEYNVRNFVDGPLKMLGAQPRKPAIAFLRTLRIKAVYNPLQDDGPPPQVQDAPYSTEWLNGPFALSAAATKAIADAKASSAKQREANKQEKAKREAYCAEAIALGDQLQTVVRAPIAEDLPGLFRRAKIKLPVAVKGRRIVDAGGEVCLDPNWRFGDQGEAVLLAVALAINAATGWGRKAEPEAVGDPELTPALQRLAGVKTPAPAADPMEA